MVDLSVGRMILIERVLEDRVIEEFWEEIYQEFSLYRPHEVWVYCNRGALFG